MPRVLQIGHWCRDYIWNISNGFATDAVYAKKHLPCQLGGAVNFAVACAKLDASVVCAVSLGRDNPSSWLTGQLSRYGIETYFSMIGREDSPWTFVIESEVGWRTALAISGTNDLMTNRDIPIHKLISGDSWDVVHYGYPSLTPRLDWQALSVALSPVARIHAIDLNGVDGPNSPPLNYVENLFLVVKGNLNEWRNWRQTDNVTRASAEAVEHGVSIAVVTMGAEGHMLTVDGAEMMSQRVGRKILIIGGDLDGSAEYRTFRSAEREGATNVRGSVVGVGDAFMAGLMLTLTRQMETGVIDLPELSRAGQHSALHWMRATSQT